MKKEKEYWDFDKLLETMKEEYLIRKIKDILYKKDSKRFMKLLEALEINIEATKEKFLYNYKK